MILLLILERNNTGEISNKYFINNVDFEEMLEFMYSLPPLPNPRRPTTFLKRPQVTFSPIDYDFGQKTTTLPYDENVPNLIKTSKKIVEEVLSKHGFSKKYNGAHVSMYPDGSAGLDPHEDDEPVIDQSVPIASISFGETRSLHFIESRLQKKCTNTKIKGKSDTRTQACKNFIICTISRRCCHYGQYANNRISES